MSEIKYPPGPPSRLPFGLSHTISFLRSPLGFIQSLTSYGDLPFFYEAGSRIYFLNHPDLVREMLVTNQTKIRRSKANAWLRNLLGEGLITSDGDYHLQQRRLLQPAFHKRRVNGYADIMTDYAVQLEKTWRDGEVVDIQAQMMQVTLAIVTKSLFSVDVEKEEAQLGVALTDLLKWFERAVFPLPIRNALEKLPLPSTRRFHAARDYVDKRAYELIEERRHNHQDYNDVVAMMVEAQEGDYSMSNKQIRDQVVTMVGAGFETSALGLMWMWYLLAQHPEVQAKLHAELDQVLGGRRPTLDDVPNLRYTEAVIAEALRIYTPVWTSSRVATEDITLGGYSLKAGSLMVYSPYFTHRDSRFWPDAEKYDPERWIETPRSERPKFSYIPFGGGARVCLGEPFFWLEAVLILAILGQNWSFSSANDQPIKIKPLVALRPSRPVQVKLERRKAPVQATQTQQAAPAANS